MESEINQRIEEYLLNYIKFLKMFEFNPRIIRCLFINAYNHFLSGRILAERGLIPQSNNCLRMGLESEWIGLILVKNRELGLNWAFGLGDEEIKKRLIDLERPFMIRKILGDTLRIKIKDRDEIYSALSDKSHTKLSSVARFFIPPNANPADGYIDCIPLGGMEGERNISRILLAIETVLGFALADIEECLNFQFMEKGWTWNRTSLMHISEGGFENQDGMFEPHISSKGHPGQDPYQAAALLSAIRHKEI